MLETQQYFSGTQAKLAEAIVTDSPEVVQGAVKLGALVNQAGREGLTPLLFAVVNRKRAATEALLNLGADPNKRANDGHNAVTVAARIADTELVYLRLMLAYGGDPNTRLPNQEPIAGILIGQGSNDGLRLLAEYHADLNVLDRTKTPAILQAALVGHWDNVSTLLELGSKWDVTRSGQTLAWIAHKAVVRRDSPMLPFWERTIAFLKERGVTFPPPSPQEVLARRSKPEIR